MLLAVSVPATNLRGPLYMDHVLSALHQANPAARPLTLTVASLGEAVRLLLRVPPELLSVVKSQLYAQYPDCRLEEVLEEALAVPPGWRTWSRELTLTPDLFPLKRYVQFEDPLNRQLGDPLTAILTTLEPHRRHPLACRIEFSIRPVSSERSRRLRTSLRCVTTLRSRRLARLVAARASSQRWTDRLLTALLARFALQGAGVAPALDTSTARTHDREADLQAAADKLGRCLFDARVQLHVAGPPDAAALVAEKLAEIAGSFGQYCHRQAALRPVPPARHPWKRRGRAFLLSAEEIATLWHPPTQTVRAPALAAVESRELPPPLTLPTPAHDSALALLGVSTFRGKRQLCGILPEDRRRHLLCLGKTGMGKSTLLHRLLTTDIASGRGVALLDPHGDLCEAVLSSIPPQRTGDVILFDLGDAAHALSFNVLACAEPAQRPLVASGVLSAFKKVWGEFWGPRMEHILRYSLLTLLEVPGSTLPSLVRLLTDGPYREELVAHVSDPLVRHFWQREFAALPAKLQAEALSPILNKVGAFVASPLLRHVVGQAHSRLNLRAVMDEGQVLLVNLSKGRVGDDASALLGSFLVTALQLAAMSRAAVAEAQRRDFYLYVDEFQNYATESFAVILSEARKYRLALTVANQYLAQLEEATLAAVFGNIGSLLAFQVGVQDAEILAAQFGGDLTPQDLLTLPAYRAYVRLLIGGTPSRPFSLQTLPPPAVTHDPRRGEIIRKMSRSRYARPASEVEREIQRAFA